MNTTYYRGELESRIGLYPALAFGSAVVFPYTDSLLLSTLAWLILAVLLGLDRFFRRATQERRVLWTAILSYLMITVVPTAMVLSGNSETVFVGKIVATIGLAIFILMCLFVFRTRTMERLGFSDIKEGGHSPDR